MIMTCFNTGAVADGACFGQPSQMALPEVYLPRPAIKIPRSVKHEYTNSELSTAAAMLAKMRRRLDVIDRLKNHSDPMLLDADRTLDAVLDKLLEAI